MGKCWSSCIRAKSTNQQKRETGTAYKQDIKTPLLDVDLPDDTPVLYIEVISGKGPWEDYNPYVELRLVPNDPELGGQVQRTSHKPRTNKPSWEPPESFKIVCSDVSGRAKIVVSVISQESALGVGYICVKDVTDEKEHKTVKLSNPDSGKAGVGEVTITIYKSTIGEAANHDQHVCYEFQRKNIVNDWGSDYPGHLLPTDPGRYCSSTGQNFSMKFDEVIADIPRGWSVEKDWRVVATADDAEGWQYGVDFNSTDWFNTIEAPGGGILGRFVRRRMWARDIRKISISQA